MRRHPLLLIAVALATLIATPAPASAADARAFVDSLRVPGTALTTDPATGRITLTLDETVTDAGLEQRARSAGMQVHHEPGRLRTLIAGGEAIYGTGSYRCTLGANVHSGATYYFITAGHCTNLSSPWYADAAHTVLLGSRSGSSFPGNDYGLVRYTGTVSHPSAVYTYPGTVKITRTANAVINQAVCRSGATTGVRCGVVTALNATVNYAEGTVTGLIRTNICAEPGDSGGPLYVASTGTLLGILSGGSGNCSTGGTSYYQPIGEILTAFGVTVP